ncbi:hypothetical protein [Parvicella tangerina]|uniref:Restriction endonuclease n=1 Tax=Parvicella tangerina TaxID=2829795 RepID=A0A916JM74_9FLAO|nr:hypothetical protein [Parvicella tangerina]CAG5081436.1 hypothetical protein CRYO30217_01631 [Parvicella tangerina]
MSRADELILQVLNQLNLQNETFETKYNQINEIVNSLQAINNQAAIHQKTTGTISERLCEFGLQAAVPNFYKKIGNDWNWMADFSIYGHPFNLLISVKSFKAKERLIVSGSGNNLSPTIGWGLFNDPDEWTLDRVKSYLYRSFVAIYMPISLYTQLAQPVRELKNINGNLFIRDLGLFIQDLRKATQNNSIDISSI